MTFEREGRSSYKSFFFIITLLYKVTEYIHADIKRNKYKTLESTWSVTDSLAELERLSDTAGRKVSVVS